MHWLYKYLFIIMWVAFLLYWQIAAIGAKTTARLEPAGSRAVRVVLFACAMVLLIDNHLPLLWLYYPFYPSGLITFWLGAAITLAGLLFCVWARLHLGANWSRSVTVKQDHELITSGPYSIVRHPIYTGLLTGFLGTAIALGQVRGVIAFLLILIAFRFKWRLEEQWMREQFGPIYADYARRVPAVLPRPM
jgi:protein-S-isoprenylcysteine O-methyltransferase Ste14